MSDPPKKPVPASCSDSCWSCLDWACKLMTRELFCVGDRVQVNCEFRSVRIVLLRGWLGTVISVNKRGDMKIDFDDCGECEWVLEWNVHRLSRAESCSFIGTWCYGRFDSFTISETEGDPYKLFFEDHRRSGVLMANNNYGFQGSLTGHDDCVPSSGEVRIAKISQDELVAEFMDGDGTQWSQPVPVLRKATRGMLLTNIGFLPEPLCTKVTDDSDMDAPYVYGCCAMQGWRRAMEDAHVCIPNYDNVAGSMFFAVFDGHCGAHVARFCGSHVAEEILSTTAYQEHRYAEAMRESFLRLDERMLENWPASIITDQGTDPADSNVALPPLDPHPYISRNPGCTALACFIEERRIHLANAGDSRAVLCRAGQAIQLTTDHSTAVAPERGRIEKAGGYVANGRVNGMLQPTRSIGDFFFKTQSWLPAEEQQVTANAETFSYDICDDDEFMVLACDGIWDDWTSQEVVDFIRERLTVDRDAVPLSEIAGELLEALLSPEVFRPGGGGCDNMSCIIVVFAKPACWYALHSGSA